VIAIEQNRGLSPNGYFASNRLRAWMFIAIAATLLSAGGWAARGFTENGLRLGSEFAWRFTFLIYFLAIVAGPLGRLVPSPFLRRLGQKRCQLIWGFCASLGVYLLGVLLPNLLVPTGPDEEGLTGGMTMFVLFGAALSGVIAFAASRRAALFLGEKARGTVLGVGLSTMWLVYVLSGLAQGIGPQRHGLFYGASLGLMTAALLLGLADRMAVKLRGRREYI
jgi:hypothetical protein